MDSEYLNDEFSFKLTQLISKLDRRRRKYINDMFEARGLKGPSYMMFIILYKNPGVSQDFIAEYLSMDKGNVARHASFLETHGYITREPQPKNKRKYNLRLTESGRQLYFEIIKALNYYSTTITKGLSMEDKQHVMSSLSLMLENT